MEGFKITHKKSFDLHSPAVHRQKLLSETRIVSGWSTASRPSQPGSRHGVFAFPLETLGEKGELAVTLTSSVTQRESLPLKKPTLLLGTWTAGSTAGWAKRSVRPALQIKSQVLRKAASVGLFDFQRPKAVVQGLPRLGAFSLPKARVVAPGGGFRHSSTSEQHCKCCQRLESLHAHPVLGDLRITTVLN